MTFWFAPFTDLVKKKVCRYLLHRYLGSFIHEKISLDQLNVDFYNGKGTISDIVLDPEVCIMIRHHGSCVVQFCGRTTKAIIMFKSPNHCFCACATTFCKPNIFKVCQNQFNDKSKQKYVWAKKKKKSTANNRSNGLMSKSQSHSKIYLIRKKRRFIANRNTWDSCNKQQTTDFFCDYFSERNCVQCVFEFVLVFV